MSNKNTDKEKSKNENYEGIVLKEFKIKNKTYIPGVKYSTPHEKNFLRLINTKRIKDANTGTNSK